jgi:hypothetical protein
MTEMTGALHFRSPKTVFLGFGNHEGRFSLLILSPHNEVVAAAPVLPQDGTHFTQWNGIAGIRVALRMLYKKGIVELFQPNRLVQFLVGRFQIIDSDLFLRYRKYPRLQELLRFQDKYLTGEDIKTFYVRFEDKRFAKVSMTKKHRDYVEKYLRPNEF